MGSPSPFPFRGLMGVQVRGAEGDGGEDGAGGGCRAAGAVGPEGVRPEREAGPGRNHRGGRVCCALLYMSRR